MPHGADMGAAAAANLAEQQERSTVGMKTKSKVPSSKSKGTFQGYGGDAPLQTTEAKMETTRRRTILIIYLPLAYYRDPLALAPPLATQGTIRRVVIYLDHT